MHIGCELHAPEGLGSLQKDVTYYFVGVIAGRAILAWFFKHDDGGWRVRWIRLPQSTFEAAILNSDLIADKTVYSMPPWHRKLEGLDIAKLDADRTLECCDEDCIDVDGKPKRKKTFKDFADDRYCSILGLTARSTEVWASEDPMTVIGKHARSCKPPENSTRLAVWFVAYEIAGRNLWSLIPMFPHIGNWDRAASKHCGKKVGRRPLYAGSQTGHSAVPLIERIENGYVRHVKAGKHMKTIYIECMLKDFGCRTRTGDDGVERFYHPENLPFPSDRQFSYHVHEKFGRDQVQRARYGEALMRAKSATSEGRFSEIHANILEAMEVDAQHIKDRPMCLLSRDPAPPLIVARGVDTTTARGVALGVSIVSEKTETYKAMAFTALVPGSLIGRILNFPLTDDDLPGAGFPPGWTSDRGAGAAESLVLDLERKFPISEMTPSYQGQSKPVVESSHTRAVRLEGAPTYVQSSLTTADLIKREYMNMIAQNKARNIKDRLTPQMIADGVLPNPKSMWKYMECKGLISARPWPLADAIRTFLRPVDLAVRADGLYLNFIKFDSDEMRETRMSNRLSTAQEAKVRGYVFPLCASIAWVESKNGLIQVAAKLPIRGWNGQLYLSLAEIEMLTRQLAKLHANQRQHALAVWARTYSEFEELTGKNWNSGSRRSRSSPKAGAAAMHEAAIIGGVRKAS